MYDDNTFPKNRKKFALRRKYLIKLRSTILLIVNRQRYMRVCTQILSLILRKQLKTEQMFKVGCFFFLSDSAGAGKEGRGG